MSSSQVSVVFNSQDLAEGLNIFLCSILLYVRGEYQNQVGTQNEIGNDAIADDEDNPLGEGGVHADRNLNEVIDNDLIALHEFRDWMLMSNDLLINDDALTSATKREILRQRQRWVT